MLFVSRLFNNSLVSTEASGGLLRPVRTAFPMVQTSAVNWVVTVPFIHKKFFYHAACELQVDYATITKHCYSCWHAPLELSSHCSEFLVQTVTLQTDYECTQNQRLNAFLHRR